MRFGSTLPIVRRALLAMLIPWLVACSQEAGREAEAPGEGPSAVGSQGALAGSTPGQALTAWSRGKALRGAPESVASGGHERELAPVGSVDPAALAELVGAAPKSPAAPTGEDGGTAVGTETRPEEDESEGKGEGKGEGKEKDGEKGKAKEAVAPAPQAPDPAQAKPKISIGPLTMQAEMASSSMERAARAQLYWNLIQRCRDASGQILPPDVITLVFRIDEDGYIMGSSIIATPSKTAYEDAARCMRRELSAATFRAPPGGRGMPTTVTMTVPSVD